MSRLFADLRTRLLPITLTQLVGLACGIAGVKLSSQLIAPADFGRYGVFLTFTPLGMSVVHAGLAKFTARHWAGADDKSLLWREIIRPASAKLPWLLLAAALAALLMAGREWLGLLPFIFFAAAFLSYGSLAQVALQADRRHWADFFISAVGSPTRSFLPPLFYWASGGTMVALYGGYTLHALAFAAIALWILPARARPATDPAGHSNPAAGRLRRPDVQPFGGDRLDSHRVESLVGGAVFRCHHDGLLYPSQQYRDDCSRHARGDAQIHRSGSIRRRWWRGARPRCELSGWPRGPRQ